ncbi:arginine--tRNA ligase MSR1 KNAG_0B04380 [Huiozyma naganishii CBS 8797]|uniref:arginine--tRNA ligase n=1 Tax=Huiozyma naganishii (strain ATCC MYA-139 / BCRC 22969 / CBS 8797 / KCTC 17520 / NBRC 10181 / NCYC 3082 / Yp74L-3) TaxID=1071383 RepID=J7RVD0_HUIN7|nr:hypothetical protein KNAG_0B04380 [Kazachstania naganishii CBS 8797]CCK68872.1 hypothetical protein KNAG_0B04380 [Kazachstania naganishii CBS 8797]
MLYSRWKAFTKGFSYLRHTPEECRLKGQSFRSYRPVYLFCRFQHTTTQSLSKEPSTFPSNVLVETRTEIAKKLHELSGIDKHFIYESIDRPNKLDSGDLLLPVPRLKYKCNSYKELAKQWAAGLSQLPCCEKVVASGPFIQFFLNHLLLTTSSIPCILQQSDNYGRSDLLLGKRTLIEYSSPNIAKPFHAGHLRSTIIGGFLSNLHETLGSDVIRMNYLGDWGRQFGILAVGFEMFGDETKLEQDPIYHLFDVYVRINKEMLKEENSTLPSNSIKSKVRTYFKNMEEGDPSALQLWKRLRDLSIQKYAETYSKLNIKFDSYSGESSVPPDTVRQVLQRLGEKGLTYKDNGATAVDLSVYSKNLGQVIIQKSDDTSLYVTRDIGAAVSRYEKYHFDKMIYVISSQQDLYMSQLFKILELLGYEWAKDLAHVNFGMVKGMSTRKGNVVFLDTIINEATNRMLQVLQGNPQKCKQVSDPYDTAQKIAISAIMIQDMQSKRVNNYDFKWDRMLSFEGDTGPYLEYTHSRLYSIGEKCSDITMKDCKTADFTLLTEPLAINLVRLLVQYPDVLLKSLTTMEPSTVVSYLFRVAHQVSSCYNVLWVAGQEPRVAAARLALYCSAKQVLKNGMRLIGLTPVNRM